MIIYYFIKTKNMFKYKIYKFLMLMPLTKFNHFDHNISLNKMEFD